MSNYPPNINTSERDAVDAQSTNEWENGATDSLGETSEELFGLRLEENQTCLARVIIQDKKIDIFGRRFAEDYAVINVPVKRGNGDIDMKNWMALGLTERDVDGTKVPYIVFGNHEINNIKQVSVDDHLALMEELKGKTEGLSQLATIEQTPDVDHQSSSTEGGGGGKEFIGNR